MCRAVWICLILAGLLISASPQAAAEIAEKRLTFEVLRGAPLNATIDDICCGASRFAPAGLAGVRTHYGEPVVWLKFERLTPGTILQLTPVLDEVSLFTRSRNGGIWNSAQTGDMVAGPGKQMRSPFMALPVPPDSDPSPAFVRVVQANSVTIAATAWLPSAFDRMQAWDRTIKIFLLGFVASVVLYNGIVSLLLRDGLFALNAVFVLSLFVQSLYLSGYGVAYIWPELPELSNSVNVASLFWAIVAASALAISFLRRPGEPLSRFWPVLVAAGSAFAAAASALAVQPWVLQLWMLSSTGLLLVSVCLLSASRILAGSGRAKLLLVPFAGAVVPGSAAVVLEKIFGLQTGILAGNGLELTLAVAAVLFSLVLTARNRLIEGEYRAVQQAILEAREDRASTVLAAHEADRRRFAQELHDRVGQDFLVVLSNLKQLSRTSPPADWKGTIGALVGSATPAVNDLRRILAEMYPASLDHLGLAGALRDLFGKLESRYPGSFELMLELDENRLSASEQLHVFRIVQACTAGIGGSAETRRCRATIATDGDWLQIVIEDDGYGFDLTKQPDAEPDPGFVYVNERVRALGGNWTLAESELGGQRIDVAIPLAREARSG